MTVFYRKYRPQKLSEIIGQEAIVSTLLLQLEAGKIGHGYLFCGPRGTGKTSAARIFAKAVNCQRLGSSKLGSSKNKLNPKPYSLTPNFGEPCNKCNACISITDGSSLDLIEIDAASNRGIDEIRDLREKIKLSPVSLAFKVYIIDEAHMLTTEAFNALLKTLEEPPAHAIFILATTELGKIPSTIASRLQRFNFSRASRADLAKSLAKIVKAEGIKIAKESIVSIGDAADGSYRDAVSILDQLSANKKEISESDVKNLAKTSGWNELFAFTNNLSKSNARDAIVAIEEIVETGADVSFFAKQVILFLEKILYLKIGVTEAIFDEFEGEQADRMKELASSFDLASVQKLMRLFLIAEGEMKLYPLAQIPLVLAVCKYCEEENVKSEEREAESENVDVRVSGPTAASLIREALPAVDLSVDSFDIKPKSGKKSSVGKNASKSMQSIEEKWPEFLNKVKTKNAHVVALLRSTKPIELAGKTLTMEVFYRFHKEKLEELKIRNMLDTTIGEVTGKDIKLRFVLAKRESRPTAVVARSDVVDINQDELERMAQEIFSK